MKLTSHSRNIIFIYMGDAASRFLGLLAVSYLAKILGPSDFGTISIGLAVLAYALVLGNSGLKLLGTRKVAGEKEDIEYLTANIFMARLLLSTIAFILGFVTVYFFVGSSDILRVTIIYLLGVFPAAFLLEWFFQGRRNLGIIAGGKVIAMIVYLLIILLFVRSSGDVVLVAWGWIWGITANCIFLGILYKVKKFNINFNINNLQVKSLLIEAVPLGIANIIAQLTTQFPPIYLGLVATTSQVGFFSAAFKLIVFLLIVDRVFHAVFFPGISRCFKQFPEKLEENVHYTLKITTVAALIVGIYAVISGKYIINFIFGTSFAEAVPIFQLLVVYFVLNLINSVFTFTLIGMEKEKQYSKSLLLGMIAFILTTVSLSGPLGTRGVACGLIFYQFVALISMVLSLKRQIELNYFRLLLPPITGTIILVILLMFYVQYVFYIKIIIITFLGLPYIAWLGGIGRNEFYFLKGKLL